MASILDSLTQSLTPETLTQIGRVAGLNPDLVSKGMNVIGPLVTGALANNSLSSQQLDALLTTAPETQGGLLSSLTSFVGSGSNDQLLSKILGSGTGAITRTLEQKLGFNTAPLLAMAAPLILNLLRQTMKSRNLDASGMAAALQTERQVLASRTDEAAQIARAALDAGKEAESIRGRYSAEQWTTIRLAPLAAAEFVIRASSSGAIGIAQEMSAAGEAISTAAQTSAPSSLLNIAFAAELTKEETERVRKNGEGALNVIKDAILTVSTKNPGDALPYGQLLMDVASKVAEAAKEGGVLGIGGTRVSKEEQAALDQLRIVVGAR